MKYNINIPGWMSTYDLDFLYYLASCVSENGHILEIGTFLGRSTSALVRGKHDSVSLDIVDTWSIQGNYLTTAPYPYITGDQEWFTHLCAVAHSTNSWAASAQEALGEDFLKLTAYQQDSRDFEVTKDYVLIFIDSGHSFSEVKADIDRYISDKALIIGDDFSPYHPGVSQAIATKRFEKNYSRTVIIPQNTKLWTMLPMNSDSPWKDIVFKSGLL
jgi:hypothetical protein